jgi:corrinoid protein of di/trimethylamine methyltransferase
MVEENLLQQISLTMTDLDEKVVELVEKGLGSGLSSQDILEIALAGGLELVGKKYESKEYYLPELLKAGQLMLSCIEILKKDLQKSFAESSAKGKIVLGTVEGDVHSLGKDIVCMLLRASGFEVIDLGVNVKNEKFLVTAKESNADIVALSAIMTTTMVKMPEIIQLFKDHGAREDFKIILGGAAVTNQYAIQIGADAYGEDAAEAVRIAKKICK